MNKSIRKTILLTTIFSMCFGFSAIAGIEQSRVAEGINGCECSFWGLKSEIPQGNYTLLQDYSEHSILVHTSQWNEYKLLVSQGSPEVIDVWGDEYSYEYEGTDYFKGFYLITGYRLKGQKNVNLPKDKYIKITDPYNCDHLSILKYLGKTLDSNTLLDVNKYKAEAESKVKEEVAKKYGTAEERAKKQAEQQAEAKADQQQIDLNNQINAELNTKSENKAGQKTALPYSSDYIKNYRIKAVEESHNKVWASFDNERNYVQQWLTANGFKNLKELENIRYNWKTKEDEEKSAKYRSQSKAAQQYYKDIESGVLSQNCSMGDWIRYNLKKDLMGGWNGLAMWANKVDISIVSYGGQYNDKLMSYQDINNINKEIYRMIESNLSTIYSYNYLTLEQKISLVEQLNTQFISPFGSQGKKYVSGYESRAELINKIKHKWSTEYLTEADKEEMRKKGKDYWTEQQWKDYLD